MPNAVSTQAISDLGPKLVRAEQALTAIPPGGRIYLGNEDCLCPFRKVHPAVSFGVSVVRVFETASSAN